MASKKVSSACNRCRRQKLKCDVERPCIMCRRAGAQCTAAESQVWRSHNPGQTRTRTRKTRNSTRKEYLYSRLRKIPPERTDGADRREGSQSEGSAAEIPRDRSRASLDEAPWGNSSSTIVLVEEAFHHHDTTSPGTAETSALGYSQTLQNPHRHEASSLSPLQPVTAQHQYGRARVSLSFTSELTSLLPSEGVTTCLVNNYFDKIHWCILLFHQRDFRTVVNELYTPSHPRGQGLSSLGSKTVGSVCVLLAVCALSLKYTNPNQQAHLVQCGVDPVDLRERILTTLRLRVLDILALGSLEAVQTCVLLGSYYLYHGEPELAWPLCGCALRLAQALQLHRRSVRGTSGLPSHEMEARKRCWWAVHEIETFCSMTYGFPLSISDTDCDVEPLDPHDPWSLAADEQPPTSTDPNLLAYKCAMSKLSSIIKSALGQLYRSRKDSHCRSKEGSDAKGHSSLLQLMLGRAAALDARLVDWYAGIPLKLRINRLQEDPSTNGGAGQPGDSEQDPSKLSFEEQLFRLQALALKLGFESARILIHRPLLSYKVASSSKAPKDSTRDSIQTCRDSALQISLAGRMPIFKRASMTYALNYISLHFLTAGVTLCIMAGLDPLHRDSFECKLGVRRLMEMQIDLKSESIIAEQGLQILRKLMGLLMKKETDAMLNIGSTGSGTSLPSQSYYYSSLPPGNTLNANESGDLRRSTRSDLLASSTSQEESDEQQRHSTAPTLGIPDIADGDFSLDLYEDPLMAQAVLDVEQAMNDTGDLNFTGPITHSGLNGDAQSYPFIRQDQTWMWDPVVDLGRLGWDDGV